MTNFLEYHKEINHSVLSQIEKARERLSSDNFQVYDTYTKDFKHCGLYQREYDKCMIMQTVPVIGADSNIYFCHDKAYAPEGILGSILNKSFKEVWFSEKAKERFKNFSAKAECQHHCANDTKNIITLKMIEELDNLEKYKPKSDKHKNFI